MYISPHTKEVEFNSFLSSGVSLECTDPLGRWLQVVKIKVVLEENWAGPASPLIRLLLSNFESNSVCGKMRLTSVRKSIV